MDVLTAFGVGLPIMGPKLIAFCGGGGKTTTMFSLARQFQMRQLKVLVTTTTMIYQPDPQEYNYFYRQDQSINWAQDSRIRPEPGTITVMGRNITAENKLTGLPPATVSQIYNQRIYDIILVEADGARGRPIKAPANHEPVIPNMTSAVIGIIGMDCYGKPIDETWVHRPQLLSMLTGRPIGATIDVETIIRLILSPFGLFKNAPATAEKVLFMNKVERAADFELAEKIATAALKETGNIRRVVSGSIQQSKRLQTLESVN